MVWALGMNVKADKHRQFGGWTSPVLQPGEGTTGKDA